MRVTPVFAAEQIRLNAAGLEGSSPALASADSWAQRSIAGLGEFRYKGGLFVVGTAA